MIGFTGKLDWIGIYHITYLRSHVTMGQKVTGHQPLRRLHEVTRHYGSKGHRSPAPQEVT